MDDNTEMLVTCHNTFLTCFFLIQKPRAYNVLKNFATLDIWKVLL